jgi:hypothetical protein
MTGRIFDRLEGHYGQGHVFMDIDNIPYGTDFRHHLQDTLDRCDILLVVVGPRWFGRNEADQPRLFEESDWVRLEVATALEKKIPVIPLLVEGARMPKPGDLPKDLEGFAYRQAAVLDVGVDFRVHMERLTKSMDRILALRKSPEPQAALENTVSVPKDETPAPTKLPEPQPEAQAVSEDGASVEEESLIAQASIHQADEASPPTAVAETGLAADHTEQANLAIEQPTPEENLKNELRAPAEIAEGRQNGINRANEMTSSAPLPSSTSGLSVAIDPEISFWLNKWAYLAPFFAILAFLIFAVFWKNASTHVESKTSAGSAEDLIGQWCELRDGSPVLYPSFIKGGNGNVFADGFPPEMGMSVSRSGSTVSFGTYYYSSPKYTLIGSDRLEQIGAVPQKVFIRCGSR